MDYLIVQASSDGMNNCRYSKTLKPIKQIEVTSRILYVLERNPGTVLLFRVEFLLRIAIFLCADRSFLLIGLFLFFTSYNIIPLFSFTWFLIYLNLSALFRDKIRNSHHHNYFLFSFIES